MASVPVERIYTSTAINSTKSNISTGTDLSFRHNKTSNYGELPFHSTSQSQRHDKTDGNSLSIGSKRNGQPKKYVNLSKNQSKTSHKSLTCKNILIVLSVSLLGLIAMTALVLSNVILYLMLPTICKLIVSIFEPFIFDVCLVQTPANQTNSTNATAYAKHCAGVSPYTRWTYYNVGGITMTIITTNCSFNSTPFYYTSIYGISLQDDLTGVRAIYGPTQYGFTIYCQSHNGFTGTQMLNYSQIDQWNVSWVGIYY
jgi:hypothetical protein